MRVEVVGDHMEKECVCEDVRRALRACVSQRAGRERGKERPSSSFLLLQRL